MKYGSPTRSACLAAAALAFLPLVAGNRQHATPQLPNIIQIMVDDLGYADLSFRSYASLDVQTPGIDRLRQNGMFCAQTYATAPISRPARTGLITGRYQQRWGNYWFGEGGLRVPMIISYP